jgi:hypothetical protein
MKVILTTGPQSVRQSTGSSKVAAAIAAFNNPNNGNAQAEAVKNPSSVSVEELGAVTTGQTHNSSTPSEAPQAETKAAEEPLSSQYAVLARKEKALRAREQQFRAREEAARRAAEEAAKPKAPAFDESKYISRDKFEEDPFSALEELGLDYDKLTQRALNAPSPEQRQQEAYIRKLESRLAQIEEKQLETAKTFEQRDLDAKQQTVAQLRNETKRLVESDANFETIKETGSVNDVVELIERTFERDGYIMSVEEAAQAVEDHLIEEAIKITKIKKIQQRLQSAAKTAEQKNTDAPKQQQSKTLSNNMSSTRQLSAKERAVLAFRGELK